MAERRDEPVTGDVIENGSVRAYSWEWNESGGPVDPAGAGCRGSGSSWSYSGRCCSCGCGLPALETAGSLLFLAVGVAFLVSWLVNRGMGSLYLGSIIVALAAPDLLIAAGAPDQSGRRHPVPGRRVPVHRPGPRVSGGGVGWQAGLGAILALIGLTSYAVPGFGDLFWPLILLGLGAFVLVRATTTRR